MIKSIVAGSKNKDKFLSTKEASEYFHITVRAMARLLKKYSFQLSAYMWEDKEAKKGERRFYINKKGLLVLANIKNTTKRTGTSMVPVAKQRLAEKAMAPSITLQDVENIVNKVLAERKHGKVLGEDKLFALPAPTKEVPDISLRDQVNKLVREYAQDHNHEYHEVYRRLYSEFYYRYKINISARAKKAEMPVIDYADQNGYIEDLYNLALKLLS